MTPRELLDAFDVLAEAPNGIARLRELVLQLAVRGKLVPQDPSDEPAHAWLGKRELLLAQPTFEIPAGWAWSSIEALGELRGGGTPSKSRSAFWGGDIPWVSPKDMKRDRIVSSIDTITEAALDGSPAKRVPRGAILMVVRGMILAHSFPVAVADVDVTLNQDMKALVPFREGLEDYLLLVLKALKPHFLNAVERSTHGTCKLTTDRLVAVPLPIAPIAEQARIVARVDELMALIDRFEQARLRRESARVAFRDASLAELRDSETAEELGYAWQHISHRLESMLTSGEDASGLRDSVLELAATGRLPHRGSVAGKTAEAPCSLPEGWRWARLGDVLKEGPTNGWSPQAVEHVTSIKTLKLSATTRGEFDGRYFKYVDAPAEVVEKFWLEPDDILIQRSNTPEYVGIAARFDGSHRTFIYPDLMMRCRVTADVLPSFVHLCLNAPYNRTWFRARASGTSQSMVKLNQANVRSAWIPVPPLDVQRDIVASVKRFGSLIDSVAQAAQRASNTAARIASAFADPSSWDSPQG